ncbi:MAG TPA: hypothetical protein VGV59_06640 [Pyrinomonadaceae bacterium]|nr:hypothetical protein [Pyrinomonadaceae bacterium]
MNRLTNCAAEVEAARLRLAALLHARPEWLCTRRGSGGGAIYELRRDACQLRLAGASLHLLFENEAGVHPWRINGWEVCGATLRLAVTRRAGVERAILELVPRDSAAATKAVVAAAREAMCERVARVACAELGAGAKIESARLSAGTRRGEPGRYARVLLTHARGRVAVTAPVVELGAQSTDAFLASALIWFARLRESVRRGASARRLWLLAPPRLAAATCERLPLLRAELRETIAVYEQDEARGSLMLRPTPTLKALLSAAPRFARAAGMEPGALAARIVSLAPDAIDVVRARYGETLRFRGLAFARVRRVLGRECAWLGIEGASRRRLLGEEDWPELVRLVAELSVHRRADAPNRRHAMYHAQPEAWLESLLRREITRLDPGLIVAPVHAQFRVARESASGARPVDLLALRRDGRLVLIELKVSEDAAHALQGADYWRRVETQRLRGRLTEARLFGDAHIAPHPPLLYLVAPLLHFHRSFETLARALSPAIEIYPFDINEDWRAGVRVARRCHFNH